MQSILMDWVKALSKDKSRLIENPGVLHSYSGDWITAKMAIENNFYIGITGPVTYRNASQLHEVVENIPLEKVLVETDAPFLPPHPHRGERNEPSRVAIIAGKIAELRTIDKEEVVRITTRNAARLFCWREMD
jgi:TatD DNase family protein